MSNTGTRNSIYDFLKFIGLSAITLAHVSPPAPIMMIRSFDVPLMVILSALLAKGSYERHFAAADRPLGYFVSRIKRLAFPTWIFLTIYFVLMLIVTHKPESIQFYLASYGLTRYGIGYVWVMLVYLYVALLIPLYHKMQFTAKSAAAVVLVYLAYELCYRSQVGLQSKVIETTFYYIIPYGAIAYLGYIYPQMKQKAKWGTAIASAVIFAALAIYYRVDTGAPQSVQIAKYPPRLYFLSFGVACSFVLLLLCEHRPLKFFGHPIIRFISMHSMWIYLWHILWIAMSYVVGLPSVWFVKWAVVYIGAIVTVVIVNKCLDFIEKRRPLPFIKYLRG